MNNYKLIVKVFFCALAIVALTALPVKADRAFSGMPPWANQVLFGVISSAHGALSAGLEGAYSNKKSSYVQGIDISGGMFFMKASSNIQYSFQNGEEKPWDVRFLVGPSLGVLQIQMGYSAMQHNWVMRAQTSWFLNIDKEKGLGGRLGLWSTSMFFEYQKQVNSYVIGINFQYVIFRK